MIILASASPARAHLLKQAGYEFEVVPADVNEEAVQNQISDPELLVKNLAKQKAYACRMQNPPNSNMILAADTIVVCDGEIIGKPKDRDDAQRIIQKLAGNIHYVWTGVAVINPQEHVFAEKTEVTIRNMTAGEIETYLNTNEWQGKAGGYQIQKTMGNYITKIIGSYTNIIGLPILKVIKLFDVPLD